MKKPLASVFSEASAALVRALAVKHDEDPNQVVEDLVRMGPAARLLAKLLELETPSPTRAGRPADDDRFRAIYFTINELRRTMSLSQAYKAAPTILERKGITGPRGHKLTVKTMRKVYSHENAGRAWFDPVDPSADEPDTKEP